MSEKFRRLDINPPKDNGPEDISRKNMRINPNELRDINVLATLSGRRRENIFEPSSGGIGKRLNIPSSKFK